MQDWVVGLLAIAVGALFCFRGFMTMRIVTAIYWQALRLRLKRCRFHPHPRHLASTS